MPRRASNLLIPKAFSTGSLSTTCVHSMRRGCIAAAAVAAVVLGGLTFSTPAQAQQASAIDQPLSQARAEEASASAQKAAADALKAAIDALNKEYADHLKDPTAKLRDQIDYFTANPNPAITQDAVVAALGRKLGTDAPADIYVKRQLLSIVTDKFDVRLAPKLVQVLQSHPQLQLRPGTTTSDKQYLDQQIRGLGQADVQKINEEFQKKVDEIAIYNNAIMQLDDDLLERTPVTPQVIIASLSESYDRAMKGADSDLSTKLMDRIKTWADTHPPSQDLLTIRQCLGALLDKAKDRSALLATPPQYAQASHDTAAIVLVADVRSFRGGGGGGGHGGGGPGGGGSGWGGHGSTSGGFATSESRFSYFPPTVYSSVAWKDNALHWETKRVAFVDLKTVAELKKSLDDMATKPN